MAASAKWRALAILSAVLAVGGLLEYLLIANVMYVYYDESVPEEQIHVFRADKKGELYFESLGFAAEHGAEGQVHDHSGILEENQDVGPILKSFQGIDSFYDQRDLLLSRLDEKMQLLHQKYGKIDNTHRKYSQEDASREDSDLVNWTQNVYGPEVIVENDTSLHTRRLTPVEKAGNDILLTLRTIKKYHDKRLPLLFNTWITKVNKSNIFLMTDDKDSKWQTKVWKNGMHYILASCEGHTTREDMLCCRTGIEMAQIFKSGNEHYNWLCHVDDDMYIRIPPLIQLLSHFDPKKDAVYLGRSGSEWASPRKVLKGAQFGTEGQGYHFAVGGMYCLSRAMLELARDYLVGGSNFVESCIKSLEPDDVTIGVVVGVVLNKTLSRTEKIYTHGLHLYSTVDPLTLRQQVAFSYGFGSTHWGYDDYNAIYVPGALYGFEEDESQFRSLHCHLYPMDSKCIARSQSRMQYVPVM